MRFRSNAIERLLFFNQLTKNTGPTKAESFQKHFRGDHMTRLSSRLQMTVVITMLLASVFLNIGSAFGQGTNTGTVTGVVTDPTGAVVPGVTVTLTDATNGTRLTTVTNSDGQY